ncbi:MAG: M20/M25/M40 family metallo-hydrolase [Acidobacteria bacterium]|nr:M20/M25/M40 family metallo-hydrolase [Acidobacteriota bacterium]
MKRITLVCAFSLLAMSATAQDMKKDLKVLAETPSVSGHEKAMAGEIISRVKAHKPRTDNMGNVIVTLGSGAPNRLIVTPMDEPGYVVSGITEDGFLRVQRLPQANPPALFDNLHSAQPVLIGTRKGKWISGVVAGLSTHLQPNRLAAPRVNHPDEIYVDIGATSRATARAAGVDLLDPLVAERHLYEMSFGKMNAMDAGDKTGAAALIELLRGIDASKVNGTLTVAFVAQQVFASRGLDRLMQEVKPEEVVYVGRMFRRVAPAGGAAGSRGAGTTATTEPQVETQKKEPGSGVLFATSAQGAMSAFASELKRLADEAQISSVTETSAAMPKVGYTQGPLMPEKFAHIGVASAWPHTPGEVIDFRDVEKMARLLKAYAQGGDKSGNSRAAATIAEDVPQPIPPPALPKKPATVPATTEILQKTVEAYGVSGNETAVRETVAALLPSWAKPETDDHGNLILRVGKREKGSKAPKIVFVAHTDEIGYIVRSIADDGRLMVQSLGGGIMDFFAGHPFFVHTAIGIRPGVMELPTGWDQPGFEWPRGPQPNSLTPAGEAPPAAQGPRYRVDVGARSREEAEKLGIKVGEKGDTLTVPKKYRKLAGTRANGRSFDDRVGATALLAAVWAVGPILPGRDVTFVWSTEEEVGLRGAKAVADRMAAAGETPDYVFGVDTFVSSDSPLESKRFADAEIGKGFVIRAVDNSNVTPMQDVDKLIALARANQIPVQYGVTGGGNDGAVFLRHGAVDIPISWALRYSHSPGEVVDTRDVEALAKIVAAIAKSW